MKLIRAFARDESAATAIEYALILAGIAAVLIASLPSLAAAINTVFGKAKTAVS